VPDVDNKNFAHADRRRFCFVESAASIKRNETVRPICNTLQPFWRRQQGFYIFFLQRLGWITFYAPFVEFQKTPF